MSFTSSRLPSSSSSPSGSSGAGKWEPKITIWEQDEDGYGTWNSVTISKMKAFEKKVDLDTKAIKMIRINNYRSEMPEERRKFISTSLRVGGGFSLAGLGAFVFGPSATAIGLWEAACALGSLVFTYIAPAVGKALIYHGYVVIECTDGIWLSVEKVDTGINMKIGKDKTNVINIRGQDEMRKAPSVLAQQNVQFDMSVYDLFAWIINTQLPQPYDVGNSNCNIFCFDLAQRFGEGVNPLPTKLAEVINEEKQKNH